jgi:hypothetical protein
MQFLQICTTNFNVLGVPQLVVLVVNILIFLMDTKLIEFKFCPQQLLQTKNNRCFYLICQFEK